MLTLPSHHHRHRRRCRSRRRRSQQEELIVTIERSFLRLYLAFRLVPLSLPFVRLSYSSCPSTVSYRTVTAFPTFPSSPVPSSAPSFLYHPLACHL